jgi:hypothetical protein
MESKTSEVTERKIVSQEKFVRLAREILDPKVSNLKMAFLSRPGRFFYGLFGIAGKKKAEEKFTERIMPIILQPIINEDLGVDEETKAKAQSKYRNLLSKCGLKNEEILHKGQIQLLVMAYLMDRQYNSYVKRGILPKGKIESLPKEGAVLYSGETETKHGKREALKSSIYELYKLVKIGGKTKTNQTSLVLHFSHYLEPFIKGELPKKKTNISGDIAQFILNSKLLFGKYKSPGTGTKEYDEIVDAIMLTNFARLNDIKLETREERERRENREKAVEKMKQEQQRRTRLGSKEEEKKRKEKAAEVSRLIEQGFVGMEQERRKGKGLGGRGVASLLFFILSSTFCAFSIIMSINYFN